jgi:hypothetical protein
MWLKSIERNLVEMGGEESGRGVRDCNSSEFDFSLGSVRLERNLVEMGRHLVVVRHSL